MPIQVGDHGIAESPLYLTGAVRVKGERHMARSEQGPIEPGTAIIVVGDDLNGLVVRKLEGDSAAQALPDQGRTVFTSPQERVDSAEVARLESEAADWQAHQRKGLRISAIVGLVCSAAVVALRWDYLDDLTTIPPLFALSLVLGSAGLGAVTFRVIDTIFGELESSYRRLSSLAASCAVASTIITAGILLPFVSVGLLIALAVVAGISAAIAVLLFIMLAGQ
jgi:hypothetical protein